MLDREKMLGRETKRLDRDKNVAESEIKMLDREKMLGERDKKVG